VKALCLRLDFICNFVVVCVPTVNESSTPIDVSRVGAPDTGAPPFGQTYQANLFSFPSLNLPSHALCIKIYYTMPFPDKKLLKCGKGLRPWHPRSENETTHAVRSTGKILSTLMSQPDCYCE